MGEPTKALKLEVFERRCHVVAADLEDRLHRYVSSREEWDLAIPVQQQLVALRVSLLEEPAAREVVSEPGATIRCETVKIPEPIAKAISDGLNAGRHKTKQLEEPKEAEQ